MKSGRLLVLEGMRAAAMFRGFKQRLMGGRLHGDDEGG